MGEHKEFTRKELYDLAWSTPMTKLAKQFGLSDVGLRKICVKHRIPTPPLGYWAKLQFGKPAKAIPLPPTADNERDRVFVSVSAVREMPDLVVAAEVKALESIDAKIVVPDQLPNKIHPVALATKRALRAATADGEGFIGTAGQAGTINALIGRPTVTRAIAIIDTIAKTLEDRGQQLSETDKGVDLVIDGEHVKLYFYETKNKEAHQPTQAELRTKAKWDADRVKWPSIYNADRVHWRRWDYSPSGRLCVVLEDPAAYSWSPSRVLGRWYDRKTARVEDYLNDIIVTMHSGAALIRHNRLAEEEKERRRQEAAERLQRMQERKERIAKREAFIAEKAKDYARLTELKAFNEYLAGQPKSPDVDGVAAIGRVAQELVDRLTRALSASELNQQIDRLGLYTADDL
jgi:hypothetical protein